MVGTMVNNTLSADLPPRLKQIPGISFIPPQVVKLATEPQALVNSNYRNGLIHKVLQHAPPSSQPDALQTFNLIFDALKQSLSVALVQGFRVVLGLCALMFLNDTLPEGCTDAGDAG